MKVAVLIPCYNESANIAYVIRSVNALNVDDSIQYVPVVINDSSKDNSAEIAKAEDCVLLDLPVNLGIGGAIQTGLRFANVNHFDFAIQMDGDGQHPAEMVHKIITPNLNGEADVIIGSRFLEKEGFQSSGIRRLGIRFLRYLIYLISGSFVFDVTSGFRSYNRKAIASIVNDYPDDYPEPVAIVLFKRHALRFMEVPVVMKERMGGKSSISSFGSVYYMMKVSLTVLFTYFKK